MFLPRISPCRGITARLFLTALIVACASCKHPIEFVTSHIDVADLMIRSMGTDTSTIARTYNNDRWTGNIPLRVNQQQHLRITMIDFKNLEVSLDDRDDIEIRMEIEHPAMVQWEPWTGYGILRGFTAGNTRVRFLVWHGSHPDFITPWLTLDIQSASEKPSAP